MADNNANINYPDFSARLDERISDLSNSLVRPGHLFQAQSQFSQPWQGAVITDITDTAVGDGGDGIRVGGGGYHQNGSSFSYDGAPASNENQRSLGELSSEEELLQRKRAEAMASLSQKRAASRGDESGNPDVARWSSGTQSTPTQKSNSTTSQLQHAKRSAVAGSVKNPNKNTPTTKENHVERTGAADQKSRPGQIASAEDIDGLLAEGRVSAAANASKSSAKGQHGGEAADTLQRTSVPLKGKSLQPQIRVATIKPAINQMVGKSSITKETGGSAVADNDDGISRKDVKRMIPGQDSRSGHKSYPERRTYEPPKRVLTDSNIARSVSRNNSSPQKSGSALNKQSRSDIPSNWEVDNEFSQLQSNEIEELREWLQHTGYYDESYRRGKLRRFKRLAALEREKDELMREDLQEREYLTKHNDRASYGPTRNHIFDTSSHDLQASPSMPPPPFTSKINNTPSTTKFRDAKNELNSGVSDEHPSSHISKRQYSDFENGAQHERAEKMVRTHPRRVSKDGLNDEAVPNFMNKDRINFIKDSKFSDGESSMFRAEDGKFADQHLASNSHERRGGPSPGWGRGRGRGRGWIRGRGRGRGRGGFVSGSARGTSSGYEQRGSEELNLAAGDVAYFLIKCVAYDMVEAAKKEDTWATQIKNIDKFTDAFNNARHVVLVFSVNQSGAFQGYARMESRPGAPGVANPSWAKMLDMPLSPPFRISWYNTVETMFRYVGPLKNSFNDNHDVTYARDGQEMEAECGRILCKLLDNTLDHYSLSD
ncbi:hypothetical protein ACJ72_01241 [Emergomyces africanus]|uniref:YTH domain-containing protein n=1 Tax=Emergomyces africanus TaxID=1955775 RepID=A0A1B7P660_9EURO|nr:hypothetical protein ACJ72_01241 [Emergomyces africanus]